MDPDFFHINHQSYISCSQRKKFPSCHNTGVLIEVMLFFTFLQNKSHRVYIASLLLVKLIAAIFFKAGVFIMFMAFQKLPSGYHLFILSYGLILI
jgi:hypothetical protein